MGFFRRRLKIYRGKGLNGLVNFWSLTSNQTRKWTKQQKTWGLVYVLKKSDLANMLHN